MDMKNAINEWMMIVFIEDASFTQTSDLQELNSLINIIIYELKVEKSSHGKSFKNDESSKKWDVHQ